MTGAEALKGQWLRAGSLLYRLVQDGWRKGAPQMVNAETVRVECDVRFATPKQSEETIFRVLAALNTLPTWNPDMSAAPRDGTLVDLIWQGKRVVDYQFDPQHSRWSKKHSYLATTHVLITEPTAWMLAPTLPPAPQSSKRGEA